MVLTYNYLYADFVPGCIYLLYPLLLNVVTL